MSSSGFTSPTPISMSGVFVGILFQYHSKYYAFAIVVPTFRSASLNVASFITLCSIFYVPSNKFQSALCYVASSMWQSALCYAGSSLVLHSKVQCRQFHYAMLNILCVK